MILGLSFEFYLIDPKGKIISYSADPGKVQREDVDLEPLLALLSRKKSLPVYGDDPRNNEGQKIFSTAAIYNGKKLQGYLYILHSAAVTICF